MIPTGHGLVIAMALSPQRELAAMCLAMWPRLEPFWPVLRLPPGAPPSVRRHDAWRRFALSCVTAGGSNMRMRLTVSLVPSAAMAAALNGMSGDSVQRFVERLLAIHSVCSVLDRYPAPLVRLSVGRGALHGLLQADINTSCSDVLMRAGCTPSLANASWFTEWPSEATHLLDGKESK